MSSACINHDGVTPVFERKYWNLRPMLPTGKWNPSSDSCRFKLHDEEWKYRFTLYYEGLYVYVYCETNVHACQFYNVSVGIFAESGEVIAASRPTPQGASFKVEGLIPPSKTESIRQSDEVFVFFVEVEKKDRKRIQKSKMLKKKTQTDFRDLLLSGASSDLAITVKDKTFTCHRLILGARSPVFLAMMNHEMKEKRCGEMMVTDADPNIFEEFLHYLYTGSEEYLNWENVTELYKLSHKYGVMDLQQACAERIKGVITIENFYEWHLFSQLYNDSELSDFISYLFVENSEHIIKSETWIEFQKKHPNETEVLMEAMDKRRVLWEQRISSPIVFEKHPHDLMREMCRKAFVNHA